MEMSATVIRAACEEWTVEELRAHRSAALAALAKGSVIVSVTTGAGTAYQRQVEMKAAEAVEFFQACLDRKAEEAGEEVSRGDRVDLAFTGNEAC